MNFSRYILIFLSLFFLVGHRVYPQGNSWEISPSDPKIYLRFCRNLTYIVNNLPINDPLYGFELTHANVVNRVTGDYNAVSGSYLRLADSATDSSFNLAAHAHRIIDICDGNSDVYNGFAEPKYSGGRLVGCQITVNKLSGNTRTLLRLLEHEIGHCIGLDHDHETSYSLMSYFSYVDTVYDLQQDDKAGIISLYPNSNYQKNADLGLRCSN